jgi:hypothetical protein
MQHVSLTHCVGMVCETSERKSDKNTETVHLVQKLLIVSKLLPVTYKWQEHELSESCHYTP